jgi:hypothetical protein
MEMGLEKVDLEWGARQCADSSSDRDTSGGSSGGGGNGSSGSSSSSSGGSQVAQGSDAAAAGQAEGKAAGVEGQCIAAASGDGGEAGMQCKGGLDAVAVVDAKSTALPCELDKAVGVLPIPVIRTKQLPAQVKRMLKVAQRAFKASMQI